MGQCSWTPCPTPNPAPYVGGGGARSSPGRKLLWFQIALNWEKNKKTPDHHHAVSAAFQQPQLICCDVGVCIIQAHGIFKLLGRGTEPVGAGGAVVS